MRLYQNNNFNFESDKILSHNLIGSKGTIIIKLSGNNQDLFFIGSHLPMDKHKEDLGLEIRLDAMDQVIKYLRNNINPNKKFNILWTGDLNFRKDDNGNDQLLMLLDNGIDVNPLPLEFQDLSQIDNYGPTCKTVMYDKKTYCDETCKTTGCNNSCYDIEGKKGKRTPSYCDRVIGYNSVGPYTNYNTVTFLAKEYEFIKYSDHNPIMATVILPYSDNEFTMEYNSAFKGGGINYSIKYIKYYQKYKNY